MLISCFSCFPQGLVAPGSHQSAFSLWVCLFWSFHLHGTIQYMVLELVSALVLYPVYIYVVVCGCPILLRLRNILLVVRTWLLVCLSLSGCPFFGYCEWCRISVGVFFSRKPSFVFPFCLPSFSSQSLIP